ncbi:MAG: CotH kinase family protein [Aeromicrobium sp.]
MKNFKTALVVFVAALLPLAIFASPSSGVIGTDDQAADSGNLNYRAPNDASVVVNPPFEAGQVVKLYANFSGGARPVSFYRAPQGSDTWTKIGTDIANEFGNAYFNYEVVPGNQKIFAEDDADLETETDDIAVTDTIQSTTATLNAPNASGTQWTAQFGGPAVPGKATQLQIQRIYTHEVSDVDAVDPLASKTKRVGEWKTIDTGTQDANGNTSFSLSSPYPYRVAHRYRAVSGTAKSCDQIDHSAPTTCKVFGKPLVTPKNSGLSAVYFNTNEGHAIDTRSRYYEGEFNMTADNKAGLNCPAVPTQKLSVMKGRGNYSWSFRRQSYTLKLGDDVDICGMGENKKYALVSQDYDKALARNALAQYVGKKFDNMAWTPDSVPVDLYLNGVYKGNYMLVERIAIDSDRIDIDELKGGEDCQDVETPEDQVGVPSHPNNNPPCVTGGYILEWDFRRGADVDVTAGGRGWVGIKDPEFDRDRENAITDQGITTQQTNYIDNYLGQTDSALLSAASNNNWMNYIDMASAVDYYLAMEYMKPVDGHMWASVYMYKPRNGKLFFGPMWDFDLAAGSANRAGNVVSSSSWYLRDNLQVSAMQPECSSCTKYNTWFNQLNKNSAFKAAKAKRWNEVQATLNVSGFLDGHKANIATSAAQTYASYNHSYRISQYQVIKSDFDADYSYLRSWASNRRAWINTQF